MACPSGLQALHALPDETAHGEGTSLVQIALSLDAGRESGKVLEKAYSSGGSLISQLDWDIKPLYYAGTQIKIRLAQRLCLNGGLWSGINAKTGSMEDRDWSLYGTETNYSKHDAYLDSARFMDVNAGYTFYHDDISLTPLVGYATMRLKWHARDGYLEYPPGSAPESVWGTVISYRQEYSFPYAGLHAGYRPWRPFSVSAALFLSSYVYCQAVDNHYRRNLDFYDTMRDGRYLFLHLRGGWDINAGLTLSLSLSYTAIYDLRGDSYSVNTSTGAASTVVKGGAGAFYETWGLGLSLSHRIAGL